MAEEVIAAQVSPDFSYPQTLTWSESCSYTKTHIGSSIISSFLSTLRESWHDPVLRHWRWSRLRGRVKPDTRSWPTRPGDQAAEGAKLYRSGIAIGDEDKIARGLRLLLTAADQGLGASGINLEGSTLRQVQLTRLFAEVWLAARESGRPEQWRLAALTRSVIGALDAVTLPGGLPDMGEAPEGLEYRDPFIPFDDTGRQALDQLRRRAQLHDLEILREDGWLRLDVGPWSGLWHCPPGGWPTHEGLAHHDLGAPALHWQGVPLFVDPGPGRTAAKDHGGLSLNGEDPYPENRPGYTDAFRHAEAGPAPELRTIPQGVRLSMDGFGRFGGHRQIERYWRFDGSSLTVEDIVLGTGRPRIERRLITPWVANQTEAGVILSHGPDQLLVSGDAPVSVTPATRLNERGDELPLSVIKFTVRPTLPWKGSFSIRPVSA
jgi:hypothetical protein